MSISVPPQVVPETPLSRARGLVGKLLKDVNECRRRSRVQSCTHAASTNHPEVPSVEWLKVH